MAEEVTTNTEVTDSTVKEEPVVPAVTPEEPSLTAEPTETPTTAEPPEEASVRVVPEVDAYVLPEGVPKEISQFAKDNDMTQEQLDAVLKKQSELKDVEFKTNYEAMKTAGTEHVKTWGDKANYNLSLVRRALSHLDSDGSMAKELNKSGYGNHPAVLNFLLKAGSVMQEGGYLKSEVNVPKKENTPMAHRLFPNQAPK